MKYRTIIVSGIITACLGSVFGWGVGQIALRQRPSQVQLTMSQPYRVLYQRRLVWFGAIAGFLLGAGQACVLGEKKREDEEAAGENAKAEKELL